MGFLSWLRDAPDDSVAVHHDSSLESLIVATELQRLSVASQEALGVAAVYRARQILADTLSALPVFAGQSLVPAPNSSQDTQDFVAETVLSMEDSGDAYWRITQDGFKVLPYQNMNVTWNDSRAINRRRVYRFENQVMRTTGLAPNLLVISMNRGASDLTGVGWLESSRIAGLIALQQYEQGYFENNAMPAGILKVPGVMTPDEAKLLKQQWAQSHTQRSLGVISAQMDYMPLSFNANDSQMTDAHLTAIGDVANLSGVPAFLLQYAPPSSSTDYQNVESLMVRLWRETVLPTYARRIERAWTSLLGTQVRFDPSTLFTSSMINQANSAAVLVGAGYDGDDVAEAVGLPRMDFEAREVPVADPGI